MGHVDTVRHPADETRISATIRRASSSAWEGAYHERRYPKNVRPLSGSMSFHFSARHMRLITGHGLETTPRAISAGLLPGSDPPSLIVAIWFDLGAMGALAVAALILHRAQRAAAQSPDVAAAEIALICCASAQMLLGVAALQAWWMSSVAAAIISVRAIAQGQFRTRRPRARLFARPVE